MKNNIVSYFLGVMIFLLLPALSSFNVQAEADSQDVVRAEAEKGGYQLIDLKDLWQVYQDDQTELLLIDTRQSWEYHAGHIKGAVNFPLEPTWLSRLTQRGALDQFLKAHKSKKLVFY